MKDQYTKESAIPNKILQDDGTYTTIDGIAPVNPSKKWKDLPALANKVVNPDGSYGEFPRSSGGGGGGGIPEAPLTGGPYARQDGGWTEFDINNLTVWSFVDDGLGLAKPFSEFTRVAGYNKTEPVLYDIVYGNPLDSSNTFIGYISAIVNGTATVMPFVDKDTSNEQDLQSVLENGGTYIVDDGGGNTAKITLDGGFMELVLESDDERIALELAADKGIELSYHDKTGTFSSQNLNLGANPSSTDEIKEAYKHWLDIDKVSNSSAVWKYSGITTITPTVVYDIPKDELILAADSSNTTAIPKVGDFVIGLNETGVGSEFADPTTFMYIITEKTESIPALLYKIEPIGADCINTETVWAYDLASDFPNLDLTQQIEMQSQVQLNNLIIKKSKLQYLYGDTKKKLNDYYTDLPNGIVYIRFVDNMSMGNGLTKTGKITNAIGDNSGDVDIYISIDDHPQITPEGRKHIYISDELQSTYRYYDGTKEFPYPSFDSAKEHQAVQYGRTFHMSGGQPISMTEAECESVGFTDITICQWDGKSNFTGNINITLSESVNMSSDKDILITNISTNELCEITYNGDALKQHRVDIKNCELSDLNIAMNGLLSGCQIIQCRLDNVNWYGGSGYFENCTFVGDNSELLIDTRIFHYECNVDINKCNNMCLSFGGRQDIKPVIRAYGACRFKKSSYRGFSIGNIDSVYNAELYISDGVCFDPENLDQFDYLGFAIPSSSSGVLALGSLLAKNIQDFKDPMSYPSITITENNLTSNHITPNNLYREIGNSWREAYGNDLTMWLHNIIENLQHNKYLVANLSPDVYNARALSDVTILGGRETYPNQTNTGKTWTLASGDIVEGRYGINNQTQYPYQYYIVSYANNLYSRKANLVRITDGRPGLQYQADITGDNPTVIQNHIYEEVADPLKQLITLETANQILTGALTYKGQLKFGVMTVADLATIPTSANSDGIPYAVPGDRAGCQETQLTYEWDGTTWNPLPQGTDETGDTYDIIFWFGAWIDGHTYRGDVSAVIKCIDGATHQWDLIVNSDHLFPGEINDELIGPRTLLDTVESLPITPGSPKTLTDWLQTLYGWSKKITNTAVMYYDGNDIVNLTWGAAITFFNNWDRKQVLKNRLVVNINHTSADDGYPLHIHNIKSIDETPESALVLNITDTEGTTIGRFCELLITECNNVHVQDITQNDADLDLHSVTITNSKVSWLAEIDVSSFTVVSDSQLIATKGITASDYIKITDFSKVLSYSTITTVALDVSVTSTLMCYDLSYINKGSIGLEGTILSQSNSTKNSTMVKTKDLRKWVLLGPSTTNGNELIKDIYFPSGKYTLSFKRTNSEYVTLSITNGVSSAAHLYMFEQYYDGGGLERRDGSLPSGTKVEIDTNIGYGTYANKVVCYCYSEGYDPFIRITMLECGNGSSPHPFRILIEDLTNSIESAHLII